MKASSKRILKDAAGGVAIGVAYLLVALDGAMFTGAGHGTAFFLGLPLSLGGAFWPAMIAVALAGRSWKLGAWASLALVVLHTLAAFNHCLTAPRSGLHHVWAVVPNDVMLWVGFYLLTLAMTWLLAFRACTRSAPPSEAKVRTP